MIWIFKIQKNAGNLKYESYFFLRIKYMNVVKVVERVTQTRIGTSGTSLHFDNDLVIFLRYSTATLITTWLGSLNFTVVFITFIARTFTATFFILRNLIEGFLLHGFGIRQ